MMSHHEQFEDALWEAAAGETSPELAAHLAACEDCRRALRALTSAARGLSALQHVDAPDPRAAIRARLVRPRRRVRWATVLVAAGAATAIAAFILLRSAPEPGHAGIPRNAPRQEPGIESRESGIGKDTRAEVGAVGRETHHQASSERPAPVRRHRHVRVRAERGQATHRSGFGSRVSGLGNGRETGLGEVRGGMHGQPPLATPIPAPLSTVDSRVSAPVHQVTVLCPRRPEPVRPRVLPAGPLYQTLALPVVRPAPEEALLSQSSGL